MSSRSLPHPAARVRLARVAPVWLPRVIPVWLARAALLLLIGAHATPASAGALLVPARPGPSVDEGWAVRSLRYDARVRGSRATVTLRQVVENLSPRTLESECLIPLPAGATPGTLRLTIDGQEVSVEHLTGLEARFAWMALFRRHRDARLIGHLHTDFLRVPLFALPASAFQTLELTYQQDIEPVNGVARLVCGLRAAALAGGTRASYAVRVDMELKAGQDARAGVDSRVGGSSRLEIGPIHSPTHEIRIRREHGRHARIEAEGVLSPHAPDFELVWTTTRSLLGATMLTYWPPDARRGYFMLVASLSRFSGEALAARPKDITFAIDTSGSMRGDRLESVRKVLLRMIGDLEPEDRFNVLGFGDTAKGLWPVPQAATPAHRREAQAFVRTMQPSGGTNLEAALTPLLASPREPGRAALGLLVSDGRATVGETAREKLLQRLEGIPEGKRPRLFTLGIGVDADAGLLDQLARRSGGTARFARPFEPVGPVLDRLYAELRAPVLTNPALRISGIDASDVLPQRLPEFVHGDLLVVTGRYAKGGRAEVIFEEGTGDYTRRAYGTLLWAGSKGDVSWGNAPARLWALRRIAMGIDQLREAPPGASRKMTAAEVIGLSARFGLLTEYTGYLADETAEREAFTAHVAETTRLVDDVGRASGAAALAYAANQAERRTLLRAPVGDQGAWLPQAGGRDITRVSWPGLRLVAGHPFFWRRGLGWVGGQVRDLGQVQEEIARWSPRFYELLAGTTPDENLRLAQRGALLLELGGTVVRIVDDR